MRTPTKLTAAAAAITLGLASAALANAPGTDGRSQSAPGHNRSTQTSSTGSTTGTSSTPTPTNNGKAFGRVCQGESKKHVAGQKGTPFSQCVSAAAKLQGGKTGQTGGSVQSSTSS